jgi:WD40 repeat protein
LAFGLVEGTVKLADARTGRSIHVVGKHDREVQMGMAVAFHPNGQRLASAGNEGTVKVWDLTPGKQPLETCRLWLSVLSLMPQAGCSAPLPLTPILQLLPAFSSEKNRHEPVLTLRLTPDAPFYSVAYSPDGHRLVTGSIDGQLTLWEGETGQEIRTVRSPLGGEIWAVAFSPNGRWVASAGGDCTARLWDARSLELIQTFHGHRSPVRSLAISRDSKFLVTSSTDKTVKVWNLPRLDKMIR